MHADQLATVAVRPEPALLHGQLSTSDFDLVVQWIELNRDAILQFWSGDMDGVEFIQALRSL